MEQIALLPSGGNLRTGESLIATTECFAYSSTLSIYVHSMKDNSFPLTAVLCGPERPLVSIATDSRTVLGASDDGYIFLWSLSGVLLQKIKLSSAIRTTCGYPRGGQYMLGGDRCHVWFYEDDATRQIEGVEEVFCVDYNSCNPHFSAVGTAKGNLTLCENCQSKWSVTAFDYVKTGFFDTVGVQEVQFDPLSDQYLVALSTTGAIALFDVTNGARIMTFESTALSPKRLAWVGSQPGCFATTDAITSAVTLWNVSRKEAVATHRPSSHGCRSLLFVRHLNALLCIFTNGCVGAFSLLKHSLIFQSLPGHSETIFEVKFCPTNPDILASSSHDGTIRFWDLRKLTPMMDGVRIGGTVYSISWTCDGKRLLVSCLSGEVCCLSSDGAELWRMKYGGCAVWRVTTHPSDPRAAALTSREGSCTLFSSETGDTLKELPHSTAVFGVDFHRQQKLIATGGHDNIVRIFELESGQSVELAGHNKEVHHVLWNPVLPDLLASGSNDKTVRLWKVNWPNAVPWLTLVGHQDRVRGLCWCECVPTLCLSGSWDGSIRLWNLHLASQQGSCIAVNNDHIGDVYCLATHPQRPLLLASGSRDTTIRLFHLSHLNQLVTEAVLRKLSTRLLTQPRDFWTTDSLCLGGSTMEQLAREIDQGDKTVQLQRILSTFYGPFGSQDLADCVLHLVDPSHQPSAEACTTIQPLDLFTATQEQQAQLEKGKLFRAQAFSGSSQRKNRLIALAQKFLRLGSTQDYCDCMVEAGEWQRALSAAPAAGVWYWREMCKNVADKLSEEGDPLSTDYYICALEAHRAAEQLTDAGKFSDAMLVVQRCSQQAPSGASPTDDGSGCYEAVTARESLEMLLSLSKQQASRFLSTGNPLLAAASYASSRCIQETLSTLADGHMVELAFHCLSAGLDYYDRHPEITELFVLRCFEQGLYDNAVEAILKVGHSPHPDFQSQFSYLGAYFLTLVVPQEQEQPTGKGQQWASKLAPQSLPGGADPISTLTNAVHASPYAPMTERMAWLTSLIKVSICGEKDVPVGELLSVRKATNLIHVDPTLIEQRDAVACAYLGSVYSLGARLANKRGLGHLVEKLLGLAKRFDCDDKQIEISTLSNTSGRHYTCLGDALPRRTTDGKPPVSGLSGKEFFGAFVVLEDGNSTLSLSEARQWHEVCVFSPLGTGVRLHPF